MGKLLIYYEDVFAKHDLDVGCFKHVKHCIDTGKAPTVRHNPAGTGRTMYVHCTNCTYIVRPVPAGKMRKPHLHFQREEEAHLTK